MIKAADMLIARRADTRARADFATWKMMAKLNGASSLPAEAQAFLTSYKALLDKMTEPEAGDTTIALMYRGYYKEMGGKGSAPELPANSVHPPTDNVTAFKRPPEKRAKSRTGTDGRSRLPVALIFACLVVLYVGFRYLTR